MPRRVNTRSGAARDRRAAQLMTQYVIKKLKINSATMSLEEMGVTPTSFSRYLSNPLFDVVTNTRSTKFSMRWDNAKIEFAYGKDFAKLLDFNGLLIANPKILECIFRLWADHRAEVVPHDGTNHRDSVVRRMKNAMDKLINEYSLFKKLQNPFHRVIMKPVLFDEISRRESGEYIFLQYVIKPAGEEYENLIDIYNSAE